MTMMLVGEKPRQRTSSEQEGYIICTWE